MPLDPVALAAGSDPIAPDANPVRADQVAIRYRAAEAPASLAIYNLVGERVRVFGGLPAAGVVTWRTDNDAGRSVANGTYLILLQAPSETHTYKLVVTR